MKKKILHLFVKEKYWNQAKEGSKPEEYREVRPYWTKILFEKHYDLIHYHFRYTKKILIFKYIGYKIKTITHEIFGNKPTKVYAIDLTKSAGVKPNSSHD